MTAAERPDAGEGQMGWSPEDAAKFAHRTIDYWNAMGGDDNPLLAAAKVHAEDVLAAIDRLRRETAAAEAVVGRVEALIHMYEVGVEVSEQRHPLVPLRDVINDLRRAALRAGEAGDE